MVFSVRSHLVLTFSVCVLFFVAVLPLAAQEEFTFDDLDEEDELVVDEPSHGPAGGSAPTLYLSLNTFSYPPMGLQADPHRL